jgi:hypothetical protein
MNSRQHRSAAVLVAAFAIAGCAPSADEGPVSFVRTGNGQETVFLTQNVVPVAVMTALFDGRVVRDEAGCLRFDSPDPATVVWPKGFTLEVAGEILRVRDAAGAVLGRIGEGFRLGGGEVPSLHPGVGMSNADRARAESTCPGRFWIVGDVLRR